MKVIEIMKGNEGNRDNAYNLSNRVLAQHLA